MGELKKNFPVGLKILCLGEQHNVLFCPGGYIKGVSMALCLLATCFSISIHLKNYLHFIVSVVLRVGTSCRRRGDLEDDKHSYPLGT